MLLRPPQVLRALLRHLLTGPSLRAFAATLVVWLGAFVYCKYALWRDPHSAFFNSDHVYELGYSKIRNETGWKYIQSVNVAAPYNRDGADSGAAASSAKAENTAPNVGKAGADPVVCAVYTTVRREQQQYFAEAVGSMVADLSPEERSHLYLWTLFAETNAQNHPNWRDNWVRNVLDEADTYQGLTDAQAEEVRNAENNKNYYFKGILYVHFLTLPPKDADDVRSDYIYVLSRCLERTNAPFIAVFEDDIVFAEDWMARTAIALQELKKHHMTQAVQGTNQNDSAPAATPWFYLRLFYTETALMWESEHDYWYSHLPLTFALTSGVVACLLVFLRGCSHKVRPHLDTGTLLVLTLVAAPAFTIFAFMIGKYNVWVPLQSPGGSLGALASTRSHGPVGFPSVSLRQAGVVRMNKYGCCNQALVFPRDQVPGLIEYLKVRREGQTDTLVEDYAEQKGFDRYALTPQPIQHVGLISSRGNTVVNTQSNWAFWFETNKPSQVKQSHNSLIKRIDWAFLRS
jgi:hypothetical protein